MRTLITTIAIGMAVIAPGAAAEAHAPVTRADASLAAQRFAERAATELEDQSATGIEILTNGAARVDRSRTSVGNYLRHGRFRMGVSCALFGTNTVDGVARTLWCVGNLEVVRPRPRRRKRHLPSQLSRSSGTTNTRAGGHAPRSLSRPSRKRSSPNANSVA